MHLILVVRHLLTLFNRNYFSALPTTSPKLKQGAMHYLYLSSAHAKLWK